MSLPLRRHYHPKPEPVTEPLGWVIVMTTGARSSLTHTTLLDRDEAEAEAAQWRTERGGKYQVCPVMPA